MNILVLCTGNSARSILLESIFNRDSDGRVKAWSAGSKPSGAVHPQSLRLLERLGYPTEALTSQSWDDFGSPEAPQMDAVITVCGTAAGETCPIWPGAPVRAHWGVDDPAAAAEVDQPKAFEAAYHLLKAWADALLSRDFEAMTQNELQSTLNDIGRS